MSVELDEQVVLRCLQWLQEGHYASKFSIALKDMDARFNSSRRENNIQRLLLAMTFDIADGDASKRATYIHLKDNRDRIELILDRFVSRVNGDDDGEDDTDSEGGSIAPVEEIPSAAIQVSQEEENELKGQVENITDKSAINIREAKQDEPDYEVERVGDTSSVQVSQEEENQPENAVEYTSAKDPVGTRLEEENLMQKEVEPIGETSAVQVSREEENQPENEVERIGDTDAIQVSQEEENQPFHKVDQNDMNSSYCGEFSSLGDLLDNDDGSDNAVVSPMFRPLGFSRRVSSQTAESSAPIEIITIGPSRKTQEAKDASSRPADTDVSAKSSTPKESRTSGAPFHYLMLRPSEMPHERLSQESDVDKPIATAQEESQFSKEDSDDESSYNPARYHVEDLVDRKRIVHESRDSRDKRGKESAKSKLSRVQKQLAMNDYMGEAVLTSPEQLRQKRSRIPTDRYGYSSQSPFESDPPEDLSRRLNLVAEAPTDANNGLISKSSLASMLLSAASIAAKSDKEKKAPMPPGKKPKRVASKTVVGQKIPYASPSESTAEEKKASMPPGKKHKRVASKTDEGPKISKVIPSDPTPERPVSEPSTAKRQGMSLTQPISRSGHRPVATVKSMTTSNPNLLQLSHSSSKPSSDVGRPVPVKSTAGVENVNNVETVDFSNFTLADASKMSRKEIMRSLPESITNRFGEICFATWRGVKLMVLILDPFHVTPCDNARSVWLNEYVRARRMNFSTSMKFLVYWYGSADAPQYTLVAPSSLIDLKEGVRKKYHFMPLPVRNNYMNHKNIKEVSELQISGPPEAMADLKISNPKRRRGNLLPIAEQLARLEKPKLYSGAKRWAPDRYAIKDEERSSERINRAATYIGRKVIHVDEPTAKTRLADDSRKFWEVERKQRLTKPACASVARMDSYVVDLTGPDGDEIPHATFCSNIEPRVAQENDSGDSSCVTSIEDSGVEELESKDSGVVRICQYDRIKDGFDLSKAQILEQLPESVRSRFGEICLWEKNGGFLPALIVSPFSVPPRFRRDWLKDFRSKLMSSQSPRQLVYWYGSGGQFSLEDISTLIPVDFAIMNAETISSDLPSNIDKILAEYDPALAWQEIFMDKNICQSSRSGYFIPHREAHEFGCEIQFCPMVMTSKVLGQPLVHSEESCGCFLTTTSEVASNAGGSVCLSHNAHVEDAPWEISLPKSGTTLHQPTKDIRQNEMGSSRESLGNSQPIKKRSASRDSSDQSKEPKKSKTSNELQAVTPQRGTWQNRSRHNSFNSSASERKKKVSADDQAQSKLSWVTNSFGEEAISGSIAIPLSPHSDVAQSLSAFSQSSVANSADGAASTTTDASRSAEDTQSVDSTKLPASRMFAMGFLMQGAGDGRFIHDLEAEIHKRAGKPGARYWNMIHQATTHLKMGEWKSPEELLNSLA